MIIGFTGTRHGMTNQQRWVLRDHLRQPEAIWFRHGDCLGADAQAAGIAKAQGLVVFSHPPAEERYRAHAPSDYVLAPKDYLDRDRDIVDECNRLIACPRTHQEEQRSGTWYTIRYAVKIGRPVIVIWPDGTTEQR